MLTCTSSVHHPVPARYTRYVSIFLESILLASYFLNVRLRNRWTKIESGTKLFLRRGRSPKRIGASTRPNPGTANIAGFVPPTLCAWSNTGADCDPSQHNPPEPRSARDYPPPVLHPLFEFLDRSRLVPCLNSCSYCIDSKVFLFSDRTTQPLFFFSLDRTAQPPFFDFYWHEALR
jgi:hypothetical protein